ncbi:MAG: ferritin [Anaerolineaceae bacterium]
MLISKELNKAINDQIGYELGASHQYMSIAAYFEARYLKKFAELFRKQAAEEREHAEKFIQFVLDAGGSVKIPAVPAPKSEFATAEEAVALSLEWEKDVTNKIYALVDMAITEKNHIAREFLGWFVTEQLEEVSSMEQLLGVVQMSGEKNLLMLEAYVSHK